MDSNGNQKKTWIWGGLVFIVIVAVGLVGAVFFVKTPEQIFKTAIENVYEKANDLVENTTFNDVSNLTEHPFSVNGNVAFKTDMDLEGLEDLTKYNYGFQVGMDLAKKIGNVRFSIKEGNSDFLAANVAFQDDHAYVKFPDLFDKTLDAGEVKFEETFKFDFPEGKYSQEDVKSLLKETKEFFVKTIDKEKITVNKNVEDDYNGKTAQVEEIVYTLDEETQKKTVESMVHDMLASEAYLKRLANMSGESVEDIKTSLETAKKDFTYDEELQVIVSVSGIQKQIIEIDMIFGNKDAISYIDYNDKQTIHFNDVVLTIEEFKDDTIKLGYEYEDMKGILYFTSKKESNDEYAVTLTATAIGKMNGENVNFEVTMNMSERFNDSNVTKMNVENSVAMDALSQEDALKLFTAFQQKIAGTPFEKVLSSLMM